jgi:hypothetical protein
MAFAPNDRASFIGLLDLLFGFLKSQNPIKEHLLDQPFFSKQLSHSSLFTSAEEVLRPAMKLSFV